MTNLFIRLFIKGAAGGILCAEAHAAGRLSYLFILLLVGILLFMEDRQ